MMGSDSNTYEDYTREQLVAEINDYATNERLAWRETGRLQTELTRVKRELGASEADLAAVRRKLTASEKLASQLRTSNMLLADALVLAKKELANYKQYVWQQLPPVAKRAWWKSWTL